MAANLIISKNIYVFCLFTAETALNLHFTTAVCLFCSKLAIASLAAKIWCNKTNYAVNHKKTWQFILDYNFG